MPTSACASAGASLMPSPTIATSRPPSRSRLISSAFASGSTSARTRVMPACPAIASAVARWSPVSITTSRPRARSAATAADASGLSTSATATMPSSRPPSARKITVLPSRASESARASSAATSTPRIFINRRLPRKIRPFGPRPWMPCPGTLANSVTGGIARPRSFARVTIASASGCSEPCSRAPASASTSSSVSTIVLAAAAGTTSVTTGRPTVSVPVLSKTTVLTRWSCSSAAALLISTPCSAPFPVPTMIAVGVARPMAHGQAMTRTATAFVSAYSSAGDGPKSAHTANVSAAMPSTTGTKTAATRSARRWIGAREPCASATRWMIRARVVSAPTRVARKTKLPVRFIVPL